MERKLRNSFNLKGATTTSIPSPQTAQHHHGTRQRTAATTLQQQQQPVVYKSPVTTTTTHSIISGPVQKNEKNPNNNNNINEEVSAMTTAADADLNEQQQQEQQQQLAVAAHAKPLSRNKNEEAINDLRTRIPEIENIFDIHSRIGNGTFSTVLLGTLKKEANLPENQRRKFAIKHHIPTSHPDRIMKELQCMAKIGGTDNVCGINCCIRYNESVAFIMPYLPHDRFHDFFSRMDVAEVQYYMKNLLIALRHVHRFNVIHRDVKPSNFLYNRRKRQFLLVDFGLAQQVAPPPQSSQLPMAQHSPVLLGKTTNQAMPAPGEAKRLRENDDSHVRKASDGSTAVAVTGAGEVVSGNAKRLRCTGPDYQQTMESGTTVKAAATAASPAPLLNSGSATTKSALPHAAAAVGVAAAHNANELGVNSRKSAGGSVTMSSRLQQKLRAQGGAEAASSNHRSPSSMGGNKSLATQGSNGGGGGGVASDNKYNTNRNLSSASGPKCFCYGTSQVCNICLVKKEIHASRAGTPGYRPPEVLLKYPDQTTAVDVWASGVIFLSILSSVYPFFKAPNDYVALAEMVTIFGDKAIRKTAVLLDRLVTLSQKTKPLDLRKLCVRFRNRVKYSSPELLKKYQNATDGSCEVCKNCDQFFFNCLCMETSFVTEPIDGDDIYPASAYDLLYRLLEVNPHKRITAEEALKHPFFEECHNNNNNNHEKSNTTTISMGLVAAVGDSVAHD
uniref:non-specific serine/threonine protein kinase n=1 Tax=Musca domestica TaxID=7370 RepID=T1PLQ7_MUSDO